MRDIRRLGVTSGDTLLVHSSYDAFVGFTGKPSTVITVLQEAVGTEGTLLMPSMAFTGTAVDYVRKAPPFDVARTPSRMGLITELFRRMPHVIRSVHPTHSVAIWGRDANALAEGHHRCGTPCGAGSPFARLLERHGKILMLGADIDSLTFFHSVEEMFESRMPVSPFTSEVFNLQSKDREGAWIPTQTRLFEPAVSRRRNLGTLARALKRRGALVEVRTGLMRSALVSADDVVAAVAALADAGVYCYD